MTEDDLAECFTNLVGSSGEGTSCTGNAEVLQTTILMDTFDGLLPEC